MTLRELIELEKKATQGEVRIVKCSCGDSACNRHGLNTGIFYQGSGWDKDEAEFYAALVNWFRSEGRALAEDGERYRWLREHYFRMDGAGVLHWPFNTDEECDSAIDAARRKEG